MRGLVEGGFEFVVIGGCAVGAYSRLRGQAVLTADLDLLCPYSVLWEILEWASRHGARVCKRPQPRNIPVAVLEWRGLEVNLLASTPGLPPPEETLFRARTARLGHQGNLPVPLADPYDLLADKMKVGRSKDGPHIEVLLEFLEEEIVHDFAREQEPRLRLAGARRLLGLLKARALPERLFRRLLPEARFPSDLRFLANVAPSEALAEEVLGRAEGWPDLEEDVRRILQRRTTPE